MPKVIVATDPQQNNTNVQWIVLNPGHASYAAKLALLAATASSVPAGYGTYAVADGGNGYAGQKVVGPFYASDQTLSSWGLTTIDGNLVLDRLNYSKAINPNYAPISTITNSWGDQYYVYGSFLKAPQTIPTTGYSRLLAQWKGGSETVLYIGQSATGTGSGNSYSNLKALKDILAISGQTPTHDPTTYDIIVLCGTLSRHLGEGAQTGITAGSAFRFKNGTSSARTQILAHPVDGCVILAHARLGYGTSHGDPAAWADEGSGMFSCAMSSSTINLSGTDSLAYSNAGGTLRPLTKVASSAACAALADSWFPDPDYSGSNDRVYVRLADGSNPKTTTFIPSNGGGVTLSIPNLTYFDVYGVEFWGNTWIGTNQTGATNFTFYACTFKYWGNLRCFGCDQGSVNEGTGAFSYDQPTDRSWIGCSWYAGYVAIYDTNNGHNRVPLRTVVRDCYFEGLNPTAADNYGVNAFSAADAHSIATQGCDDFLIENCRMENCGTQTITHYLQPPSFTTPTGELENEVGYTDGYQYPSKCFADSASTFVYPGRLRNARTRYCLITNPRVSGDYATTNTPRAIAYQGDAAQLLDLAGGQYDSNRIEYNRIEGAFADGAVAYRLAHGIESERGLIANNTIRGATIGFHALMAVSVNGGSTYNPSFDFTDNDVHATTSFVYNENITNTNHLFFFDRNTYRNNAGANWKDGANTRTTLAAWQGAAQAGDTHDTNSTHVALGV